jgi:acyl dehydratase
MAEVDRSLLGEWGPASEMRVELGKVREFAKAVRADTDAIAGDGAVAPPTFLMTIAHWLGDLSKTRRGVTLDQKRLLHGEQEFEFRRPVRVGDVLTLRSRVKDVYEKQGKRGGAMTFVISEVEFRDAAGEVVAYLRNTSIETAPAS